MKKPVHRLKWVLLHLFVLGVLALIFLKFSEEMTAFKANIYYLMQDSRMDSHIDFTDYPPVRHAENRWYEKTRLVYHAGGGMDGLDYTNSKEAMENLLERQQSFAEIDFMYTSDGELVCMHSWKDQWNSESVPSLQEFRAGKIYGKYTTMTAAELVQYMVDHPKLHIIIDTKEEDQISVVKTLVDLSESHPDVTDRFIIQLYAAGVKSEIQKLYPFDDGNFLFTTYKFGYRFPNKILKICYDENISVVTVPYGVWEEEVRQLYVSKGFILFEHTVNRPDFANGSLEKGVWGFYTDFLAPEDLNVQ